MPTVVTTMINKVDEALLVCVVATPNAKIATAMVPGNNTTILKRCANSTPTARPTTAIQIIVLCLNAPDSGKRARPQPTSALPVNTSLTYGLGAMRQV